MCPPSRSSQLTSCKVHTWSHPYMTSLTDEQLLGELGWTAQIIADITGGYLPAYWVSPNLLPLDSVAC